MTYLLFIIINIFADDLNGYHMVTLFICKSGSKFAPPAEEDVVAFCNVRCSADRYTEVLLFNVIIFLYGDPSIRPPWGRTGTRQHKSTVHFPTYVHTHTHTSTRARVRTHAPHCGHPRVVKHVCRICFLKDVWRCCLMKQGVYCGLFSYASASERSSML